MRGRTVGTGGVAVTRGRAMGSWLLTDTNIASPQDTTEVAINMSNMRHWHAPVKRYIDECLAGATGPRGKDFNMRWIASMVAEVHRLLTRGGIFIYPPDQRAASKNVKLRMMYEATPQGFIVDQAGGRANTGANLIIGVQATAN